MAQLLFRKTTQDFRDCFGLKHEILSAIYNDKSTFSSENGLVQILEEAEVNALGELIRDGTVAISFGPGIYSRMFPHLRDDSDYRSALIDCVAHGWKKSRDARDIREWQRSAAIMCAERYMYKVRQAYKRVVENLDLSYTWHCLTEGPAEDVFILPAMYESVRHETPSEAHGMQCGGVIGGNVSLLLPRDEQYATLFRVWLMSLAKMRLDDLREPHWNSVRVQLLRDYRILYFGDLLPDDGDITYLVNKLDYHTIWFPEGEFETMLQAMLRDSFPAGCHAHLNIPIPHYFVFDTEDDLRLRCWKGVRDTWIKLRLGYEDGGVNDSRMSEALIVNRELPAELSESLFCCCLARGVSREQVRTLKEVKNVAQAQIRHVVSGQGVWWRSVERNRQLACSIHPGKIVLVVDYEEGPIRVAIRVRLLNVHYARELGMKANDVIVRIPTSDRARWVQTREYERSLRFYEFRPGAVETEFHHLFAFFFYWGCGKVEKRQHLYQTREVRRGHLYSQSRFLRKISEEGRKIKIQGKYYPTPTRAVQHESCNAVDAVLYSKEFTRELVAAGRAKEAGALGVVYTCLQTIGADLDPPVGWLRDVRLDVPASGLCHLVLRILTSFFEHRGGPPDLLCSVMVVLISIFLHYLRLRQAVREYRYDELTIIWYGETGADLQRILRSSGLTRFVAVLGDPATPEYLAQAKLWANKKSNIVIFNYARPYERGAQFLNLLNETMALRQAAEVFLLRTDDSLVQAGDALLMSVDEGEFCDLVHFGASCDPMEHYLVVVTRPPGDDPEYEPLEDRDPFEEWLYETQGMERVIPSTWESEVVDARGMLMSILTYHFRLAGWFELDVPGDDVGRGLQLMGSINKVVHVSCFLQNGRRYFRLSADLDVDRVLRNMRHDGEVLMAAELFVADAVLICEGLVVGEMYRLQRSYRSVNAMIYHQGMTNFIIFEWMRRVLLTNRHDEVLVFDIGGRNGELSGWVVQDAAVRYFCVDPAGDESIPKGERVTIGNGRAVWDVTQTVERNVASYLQRIGRQNAPDDSIVLILSNSIVAAYERLGRDNNAHVTAVYAEFQAWAGKVFIRDQLLPIRQNPGESWMRLQFPNNVYPSVLCEDFNVDPRAGILSMRYPDTGRGATDVVLANGRLGHLLPSWFQALYCGAARGFILNGFGRLIWPIYCRHVVVLATAP
uniref:VP3 n=1 Tax=Eyach virus TaxID=62352 RepID=A0A8G0QGD6_9REOV|nr:VP3 [Eyach virus]